MFRLSSSGSPSHSSLLNNERTSHIGMTFTTTGIQIGSCGRRHREPNRFPWFEKYAGAFGDRVYG